MIRHETNHRASLTEAALTCFTEEELRLARSESSRQGIPLRDSIVRLAIVSETQSLTTVPENMGRRVQDVSVSGIDVDALKTITANVASHYNIIPLNTVGNSIRVAASDPFDQDLKQEIELILDNVYDVEFTLATFESIKKAIRKAYGLRAAPVEKEVAAEDLNEATIQKKDLIDENKAHGVSVIRLANQILADAISAGVTNIHIEPYEDDLRVRYRIAGILHGAGVSSVVRLFR